MLVRGVPKPTDQTGRHPAQVCGGAPFVVRKDLGGLCLAQLGVLPRELAGRTFHHASGNRMRFP